MVCVMQTDNEVRKTMDQTPPGAVLSNRPPTRMPLDEIDCSLDLLCKVETQSATLVFVELNRLLQLGLCLVEYDNGRH